MRIVFHLSEPGDYFPVYKNKIPIELFGLADAPFGHLFDNVYDSCREFFPEAEYDVIGSGGKDVVSVINEKCDLLNVPSGVSGASPNLTAKVFVFSSFCAAMGRNSFCLFQPGNHFPDDLEKFAPAIRAVMKDSVASSGLVFYSFAGKPDSGRGAFYLKKGDLLSGANGEGLFTVRGVCGDADIDDWKKEHKGDNADEVFFPGSRVFSFHPATLMENLTAGNEELLALYHLLVKCWENEETVLPFLREAVDVLKGFDFLELVRGIDEKYYYTVATGLKRVDSFGDLAEMLKLDEEGNYVSGNAELHDVRRSAVINRGEKKIVLNGMRDVLVLADDGGTGVRNIRSV